MTLSQRIEAAQPDETRALVERLRSGKWLGETTCGPAADRIEDQAAEIERLRFEAESNYDHGYYDGCTASLEQSK